MKSMKWTKIASFVCILFLISNLSGAQPTKELPLWPNGIPNNPVKYNKEKVRTYDVNEGALSGKNRVFSQVSVPTYMIYQPEKSKNTGVAMVICPGGGFHDVWFDREGADFALWLAQRGVTSLVLKYRTFNPDAEGFSLQREVYDAAVYADAKQAINILRSQSEQLGIDKNKIGIGGFSAGGALSFYAALHIFESILPGYAHFEESTKPNFVCGVYPGINNAIYSAIQHNQNIPPMFLVNGAEDTVTPAVKCIQLYTALLERGVPAELHVYAKGNHGFDSGIGRGYGVSTWRNNFIAWMKDMEFVE